MIITIIISNIVFLLIGFFIRDLRVKKIKEKAQEIKRKILPQKSEVIEWKPPKTREEELSEKTMKGMKK